MNKFIILLSIYFIYGIFKYINYSLIECSKLFYYIYIFRGYLLLSSVVPLYYYFKNIKIKKEAKIFEIYNYFSLLSLMIVIGYIFSNLNILLGLDYKSHYAFVGPVIIWFLFSSFFSSILEELIFRFFLIETLKKRKYKSIIVISSIFFSISHLRLDSWIISFFIGIILAKIYMDFGLRYSILAHIIYNFIYNIPKLFFRTKFYYIISFIVIIILIFSLIISILTYKKYLKKHSYNFLLTYNDIKIFLFENKLSIILIIFISLINIYLGIDLK
ncbi:CPBP family intramembrane metalloprotease [Streptobacillus moniliformis]|nr:CPBP family intramembrane glutamic endopeptidase [Streptobacillus moniliformis]QXW65729.1 CPBP family intramembrane metalloprotease [Streptobacillus moniliformis]